MVVGLRGDNVKIEYDDGDKGTYVLAKEVWRLEERVAVDRERKGAGETGGATNNTGFNELLFGLLIAILLKTKGWRSSLPPLLPRKKTKC